VHFGRENLNGFEFWFLFFLIIYKFPAVSRKRLGESAFIDGCSCKRWVPQFLHFKDEKKTEDGIKKKQKKKIW